MTAKAQPLPTSERARLLDQLYVRLLQEPAPKADDEQRPADQKKRAA